MAKSVHIPRAADFVNLVRANTQPYVILHELAHAYHDRVLGFEHAEITAAWKRAKASGQYDTVRHIGGGTRRHYALNNPKEFFAEMTEAYLGANDYWPFVKGELKVADPRTHGLLKKLWGK